MSYISPDFSSSGRDAFLRHSIADRPESQRQEIAEPPEGSSSATFPEPLQNEDADVCSLTSLADNRKRKGSCSPTDNPAKKTKFSSIARREGRLKTKQQEESFEGPELLQSQGTAAPSYADRGLTIDAPLVEQPHWPQTDVIDRAFAKEIASQETQKALSSPHANQRLAIDTPLAEQPHWPQTDVIDRAFAKEIALQETQKALSSPHANQRLESVTGAEFTSVSPQEQVLTAIKTQNTALLSSLIPHLKEGVNTRFAYGCTPLIYAIDERSTSCVEALLKMGARIEDHEREVTPLFEAAENGDLRMVELLLQYGANITGEFDFNNETALSISAFKFCEAFQCLLPKATADSPPEGKEYAEKISDYWEKLNQFSTPRWQLFSEKDPLKYAQTCLVFFEVIDENSPHLINQQISDLAKIFRLIKEKVEIIREKAPSESEDEDLTDEDTNLQLVHRIKPVVKTDPFQDLTPEQLQEHVDRLNQELKGGKTEETIDWSTYPRFFIAQFRGIHYYRHYFNKRQRADHRSTSHLNRMAPAPAAYLMSSLTPKEHQLARESEIKANAKTIGDTFEELAKSGKVEQPWKGKNKHNFENSSDMLQQRMSNSMNGYKKDTEKPTYPASQLLYDRRICTGYPHYATSDLPMHALKYAFGQKTLEGLAKWRLRPRFQANGRTSHPYPGKLFVTMFTPLQMHLYKARHVAGMHNREQIHLKGTVAPERETSIPGGVQPEVSVYEELAVIPSFEHYDSSYSEKYGISEQKFTECKENISAPRTQEDLEKKIIGSIIEHKERQLLKFALNEANRLRGHLIFRHFNGEYGLIFEKMRIPQQSHSYSYTKREEDISAFLDKERRLLYRTRP